MNDNDFNTYGASGLPEQRSQEPNISINEIAPPSSPPVDTSGPVFRDKPPKSPAAVGALCALAGLIIGAAGIYGLLQLINTNDEPKSCDCPECPKEVASSNDLTTSFLTLEPQGNNIIYSPLSIRYGLSLLDAGAAGTTKTQIDNVLGDTALPQYQNIPDTLSLANAVFIRDTFTDSVLPAYTNTVTQNYDAEVLTDAFMDSTNMDNWVSNKTFGLINQIGFQPTADTKMVLANALAIQMDWQHPFSTSDTSGHAFTQSDGTEINATTMTQTTQAEDVSYYADDNITLLSLPLQPAGDASLDFVAVMPSTNLTDYISNLDLTAIDSAIANATPASSTQDGIELHIPKFNFNYQLDFRNDLNQLGITTAFTDDADFSKMASQPLKVSEAIHKANIDFSEDGIKAAAITVFAMKTMAARVDDQPVVVNIDRPFLFLIRDRNNGATWFTGAVYQPNLWENDAASYQTE